MPGPSVEPHDARRRLDRFAELDSAGARIIARLHQIRDRMAGVRAARDRGEMGPERADLFLGRLRAELDFLGSDLRDNAAEMRAIGLAGLEQLADSWHAVAASVA